MMTIPTDMTSRNYNPKYPKRNKPYFPKPAGGGRGGAKKSVEKDNNLKTVEIMAILVKPVQRHNPLNKDAPKK